MKRIALMLLLASAACSVQAQKDSKEEVMTKQKGTYVVNTTTLCDARGYKSTTPLKVTFKKNKIVKVEALPNGETPRFFSRVVEQMLSKFTDIKMEDQDNVDCVAGATMSSNAVKANVRAATQYYKKNK